MLVRSCLMGVVAVALVGADSLVREVRGDMGRVSEDQGVGGEGY